jgi:AraC-like DNA-binding protein
MEASIWNNLGISYELTENFTAAIDAYLKSLDFALTQGDSVSIYQSYLNLGLLYAKVTDFGQSEQYLQAAYQFFSRQGDPYNTALALQNLGILYKTTQRDGEAQASFRAAIVLVEQLDNLPGLVGVYNDYMFYLLMIKNYEAFEAELPKFSDLSQGLDNEFVMASVNTTLGEYHFQAKQQYRVAIAYFLKALEPLQSYEAVAQLSVIYPRLIECYLQLGAGDKVKEYLDKYEAFLMGKYTKESAAQIAELRAVHEVAQKEAEAEVLRVKLAQKNRVVVLSSALAGLFVVVSLITFYFLWVVKNKEKALVARSLELSDLVAQEDATDMEKEAAVPALTEAFGTLQLQELYKKIRQYIVKEEQYLDPNLKLSDVAYALGTNEKYVSQAILVGSKTRFNPFINFYRINKAKTLLRSGDLSKLSMGEVAQKSGFSHQSTFQRKFKELTGVTPYTFQRLARLNQLTEEEEE